MTSSADVFLDFDVPGYIRKVRRVRDLSQRDLALRLGVGQTTVARWETGTVEPSLSAFRALLALADWDLQVRDMDQREVASMRNDAVRDEAGRRCPAHMDVVLFRSAPPANSRHESRNWCVPGRWERDRRRHDQWGGGMPADHPFPSEVSAYVEELRLRRDVRARRAAAHYRALEATRPAPPECTCPDVCFEGNYCVAECPCHCEWPFED